MAQINENFLKLKAGYLFPEIGRRIGAFKADNPQANIISMGIGDVTRPLAAAVIEAMKKAVDEMGSKETFRGYDDGGTGYEFLRQAINENDFKARGEHSITWDGIDNTGKNVGGGIYFYQIKAGDFTQTKKMILMK